MSEGRFKHFRLAALRAPLGRIEGPGSPPGLGIQPGGIALYQLRRFSPKLDQAHQELQAAGSMQSTVGSQLLEQETDIEHWRTLRPHTLDYTPLLVRRSWGLKRARTSFYGTRYWMDRLLFAASCSLPFRQDGQDPWAVGYCRGSGEMVG